MLHASIPFRTDKDLGRAYNEAMACVPDGEWACFIDHDAMFTTHLWHSQILSAIEEHPQCGLFTCWTNRVGNPQQVDQEGAALDDDMRAHRLRGAEIAAGAATCTDLTDGIPVSGVLMVLSKDAWRRAGKFREGFFLGVDNQMHIDVRRAERRIMRIDQMYVYHWYRADGDRSHIDGAQRLILRD